MHTLRLRELRIKHKLTQQEVASRINISCSAYSLYEHGKRQMNYETMLLLVDFYNVSLDYLFGRNETNLVWLNEEEAKIIKDYKELDIRGKNAVKVNIAFELAQSGNR